MTPEQKQHAIALVKAWGKTAYGMHADAMAALLEELINAPESEPVAYATGYYAGCLSIATIDGRVLPAGTALYLAPPAPPALSVPDGWKHDCAGILANDVELWVDSCPHCGKPRSAVVSKTAEAPADVARDAERLRLFEQWTEMGYEHTKEPRFEVETESDVIEITNDERNGAIVPIAEVSTGFNGQIGIEQEANARRIVACVNACEGIPTGVLEKQGMVPIEQVTHDIEQQRDKLLAALKECLPYISEDREYNNAVAVIAEVKGQS